MDSSDPVPVKKMRGRVTLGTYGKNTKSEREAVFVETGKDRYLLRRKSGPAYGDKELNQYVGHTVSLNGFLVGTTVLAESIQDDD